MRQQIKTTLLLMTAKMILLLTLTLLKFPAAKVLSLHKQYICNVSTVYSEEETIEVSPPSPMFNPDQLMSSGSRLFHQGSLIIMIGVCYLDSLIITIGVC